MRWSKLFVPTLREEPAEGDARLRLLVRAGFARYGAEGPDRLFLGERVMGKIAGRLRSGLAALGAQEVALRSGGLSAFESIGQGGLRSYKQLPQLWFQQRGSVLEAVGFRVDAAELRAVVADCLQACGLDGPAGDIEGDRTPEPFHTPDVKTIAEVSAFTGLPESSQMKSVVMMCGGSLVLALVRGDHSLSEAKLRAVVDGEVRAATAEEIVARFGATPGSLGPVGLSGVRVLADEALRGRRNMICGANRDDYHLRHVTPGRDFDAEYADLRVATEGPGHLGVPIGAEGAVVGHLRGTVASLRVLNELGKEEAPPAVEVALALDRLWMAVAAKHRDDAGLVWPPAIAPFSVVFVPVNGKDELQRSTAEKLYEQAKGAGCDALLDDRDERPGVKFKDAELIGIPWRVTCGKSLAEGRVEILERRGRLQMEASVDDAVEFVRGRWDSVSDALASSGQ